MRKFFCYSAVSSLLLLFEICSSQNGTKVQSVDIKCILPEYPKNGIWKTIPEGKGEPGEHRNSDTILEYSCYEGYKLSHEKYILCEKNWNDRNLPTCLRQCPPLHSTRATLSCTDNYGRKTNCSEAVDGTVLTYNCKPFYEIPSHLSRTISCRNGSWTSSPICLPVCGVPITEPLSLTGQVKSKTSYPWMASIFGKYQANEYYNLCGGIIISTKLVLTAAHCVTTLDGPLPVENVSIAVGMLYSFHAYSPHHEGEYYKVQKIIPYPSYRGESRRYNGDIAVIVTKEIFKIGPTIQPVCIRDIVNIPLRHGSVGKIVGWDIKKNGRPSGKQKVLEIPYKDQETCIRELPKEFELLYNGDGKFCAGVHGRNVSVCRLSSGNGLVFKNDEDDRYYLYGVLSLGPNNRDRCVFEENSLYSSTDYYYNFIEELMGENDEKQCTLPNYPENGSYVVQNHEEMLPGDTVSPYSILKVHCNKGCATFSTVVRLKCESAEYMPKCICK